jgi:DUF3037 family protein
MSNSKIATKGYYSILQYVPDLERAEGVNVGLLLFCPEKNFLGIQTADEYNRLRRFLGRKRGSQVNFSRLNAFKTAFEERIELESGRIRTLEDFHVFINTRANQLRLTDPRPVKVSDPEDELSNLFALLVEEDTPSRVPRQQAKTAIKKQFRQLLEKHKLDKVVQEDVSLELPSLGLQLYPFSFSNGNPNVIEPETFESSRPREIMDRACRLAIEGQDLWKQEKPTKLNIIGSFKPDQDEHVSQVRHLLERNQVELYTTEEMEKLVEVIASTAHN